MSNLNITIVIDVIESVGIYMDSKLQRYSDKDEKKEQI